MSTLPSYQIGSAVTLSELEADVHRVNHRLRSAEPVSFLPAINAWLITRHADTSTIMRDAKTFTVDHPGFTTAQVIGTTMLSLDGETHQQHRRPFDPPFRKRAITSRFNEKAVAYIDAVLDKLVDAGGGDLKKAFAGPVSVVTMQAVLGMDDMPPERALALNDNIIDAVTKLTGGDPLDETGSAAFETFRKSVKPELNADPASSVLAAATETQGDLSDDDLLSNASVLLIGGIETTEGMIANALYHLLTNQDALDAVRADPSLMPKVVEESLRLEPAAGVVDRFATSDVTFQGAQIKKGDLVRVSLNGANRDPSVFPDPDRFDIFRPNLRSHVTFAHGPHVCLGLHLARLETIYALQQALERLPNLRLDPTQLAKAHPFGLVFRKPRALHAIWS